MENKLMMQFPARSENEALARVCAAAFVTPLNPTIADITDIKTAISEAVTNAIIHGYDGADMDEPMVHMHLEMRDRRIFVEIRDRGRGIEDIERAREPLFTSKPEQERSGMGFTVMEEFMDSLDIISISGEGTTIKMTKKLG